MLKDGKKMAASKAELEAEYRDVILVETSSAHLLADLRSHGFQRFDEPRFRLLGKSYPIFLVPLALFFACLLG